MNISDSSLGATLTPDGVHFGVWSHTAKKIWVCLFDGDASSGRETHRVPLTKQGDLFSAHIPGLRAGQRYGLRADGDSAPEKTLWFDPDKLLIDPYAVEIDRPYQYDVRLGMRRGEGGDTAALMPKAIVSALPEVAQKPPVFQAGGLIYELQVRAFTMLHPDVPQALRGTVAALAHPAVVAHLRKLHVSAVELMPITAWMDERHLQPLGLTNAWGYNPVSFMALDPRLCPGGVAELRDTVAALRDAGIGVILDLVFNHTAESDEHGPTLSLRGLDASAYYRSKRGRLINDTGTGNTVACDHPTTRRLVLDSLRHFVCYTGVDGFRFDLAPILGRDAKGFNRDAPLLREMAGDAVLRDRVLIAEPWDIGAGGYNLGGFRPPFLEWNDKYRDDLRRFWRGDRGMVGALATRLAGSSDVFRYDAQAATRSLNFIAAHDGMTLADMVAYERKHNEANGERNRDGHNENLSWNNGVEGETQDPATGFARQRDIKAMLATLFASRGAIMLTAGDEFGRSQKGNNNAYCQDNALAWLDWNGRDLSLETFAFRLAEARSSLTALRHLEFLNGVADDGGVPDVAWLTETGAAMEESAWQDPARQRLVMLLRDEAGGRLAVLINGDREATNFMLRARDGFSWHTVALDEKSAAPADKALSVDGRAVVFAQERRI